MHVTISYKSSCTFVCIRLLAHHIFSRIIYVFLNLWVDNLLDNSVNLIVYKNLTPRIYVCVTHQVTGF